MKFLNNLSISMHYHVWTIKEVYNAFKEGFMEEVYYQLEQRK